MSGRYFFGLTCSHELDDPLHEDIGTIGERIDGIPPGDRDGIVGADEPGEIDLIFVSAFKSPRATN
ncbi:MAG: hypothetical protein R3F60_27490 [bacterium]